MNAQTYTQFIIRYATRFRASLGLLLMLRLFTACHQCPTPNAQSVTPPYVPDYALNRFENQIVAYERMDATQPPNIDKILFIGSSTFAIWKSMENDLEPLPVLNRGVSGSTLPELTYYVNRLVFPYAPKAVVIYGGDNDLSTKKVKTPMQVLQSYQQLVGAIQKRLPEVPIFFVSIKPSPLRWTLWPSMQRTNQLVQLSSSNSRRLFYIDISSIMLGANGHPRSDFFTADSLHMNAKAYQACAPLIRSELVQKLALTQNLSHRY